MPPVLLKKNKIALTDYAYQKDVELRVIMSQLSVFDVQILTEIVHGSLKIKLSEMADQIDVDLSDLCVALNKLEQTRLFQVERDTLVINKEMRKYWESQIAKFDEGFRPDMEFLKDLLNKVPIHVLPVWYAISRTSDDIFQSIIEKNLLTPKIYKRYLQEITFDDPLLSEIRDALFQNRDYILDASDIRQKYGLSQEKLEEILLLLEFNLVCCSVYQQEGSRWKQKITPFYEWHQYLRHQADLFPKPISNVLEIQRTSLHDFGFVQDLTRLLVELKKKPKPIKASDYPAALIEQARQLSLVTLEGNKLSLGSGAETWETRHLQEQAMAIYRNAVISAGSQGTIDRELKETEKCLKKLAFNGWILFDDFVKWCTAPIGSNEAVILKKIGKRWKYQLPHYQPAEVEKLRSYVFETLFYAAVTATGTFNGAPCFCLTPFGRMNLD